MCACGAFAGLSLLVLVRLFGGGPASMGSFLYYATWCLLSVHLMLLATLPTDERVIRCIEGVVAQAAFVNTFIFGLAAVLFATEAHCPYEPSQLCSPMGAFLGWNAIVSTACCAECGCCAKAAESCAKTAGAAAGA